MLSLLFYIPYWSWRTPTHRHTTVGRTPLDEWSARSRELYLTTRNTHKRQNFMTPTGFEPQIRESGRPHTYALDVAANGIDMVVNISSSFTLSESHSSKKTELFLGPTHECTLNQITTVSSQILLASIRRWQIRESLNIVKRLYNIVASCGQKSM
jgi:hypothetical protein